MATSNQEHLETALRIIVYPLGVFVFHAVAIAVFDVYARFPRFDVPLHFLGGLSVGYSVFLLQQELVRHSKILGHSTLFRALTVVTWTVTIAVLWEFHEFLLDAWLGTHIQVDNTDTMKDLFMGTIGAITTAVVTYRRK